LAGYGLGAWLMWKHFPAKTDALAPQACFAICSGLLTGVKTPFSGRIQIVGKSPLTGTWADSNSGGSVCSHLRHAGYDALVVTGKADVPTLLVVRDGEITFEPANDLWGQEVPETFNAIKSKFGGKRDLSWIVRLFAWFLKAKKWMGFIYRLAPRMGSKLASPAASMRRAFSQRGTTLAVALSVENGDAPIKNWKGVGPRDFPIATKS